MDIDRWHHPAAAADDVQVDERARSYRRNSLHDLPIRYQELAKPTNVDKKKVRTILPGEEPPGEEDERKYTFLNGPTLASFPFILLQLNVKKSPNVHSIYGARIRTHDLTNMSCHS